MGGKPQAVLWDRRRHQRFRRVVAVEYQDDGDWLTTVTRDLSQGGMALWAAPGLQTGEEYSFRLHFEDSAEPLAALGLIRLVEPGYVRVAFLTQRAAINRRVRALIERQVVPELELGLGASPADAARVVELAAWYHELGRTTQALDLYRAATAVGVDDRRLREHMALLLLEQAREIDSGAPPLLDDLRTLLARSRGHEGPVLEGVRRELTLLEEALRNAPAEAELPMAPVTRPATGPRAQTIAAEIARLEARLAERRRTLYRGFSELVREGRRLEQLRREQAGQSGEEPPPVSA